MAAVKAPDLPLRRLPVVISPAIDRLISELMATRRQFNRSQLFRDALIEMADRDLPAGWRQVVGLEEEGVA